MRLPILLTGLFTAGTLASQTYFYVDNIVISPTFPNTTDNISISLVGGLSSTGAYVVSANASILGSSVELTVNCADPGGLAVIVPHNEVIPIGQLPAGTYTISLNGTGLGDFAPAPEHVFTVSGGGSPCDSLFIMELQYGAFDDSTVNVTVENYSSALFDYPGFILLDDNGDTIAIETVNYFGIGVGPQLHTLSVQPGAMLPTGTVIGTLQLWTGFYTAEACAFPVDQSLCPPGPCSPLSISIGNMGGAMVNSTFAWEVLDSLGATSLGSGQMTLGAAQMDTANLCLPPGMYQLQMSQPAPSGGQLVMGAADQPYDTPSLSQAFVQGTTNTLALPFYPLCADFSNSIPETTPGSELTVVLRDNQLLVSAGAHLGRLTVHDMQGRALMNAQANNTSHLLDISGLAAGAYLLWSSSGVNARQFVKP
ncbi:MAG: T9SS type A sorting domain-containing protein [Flavobacteriales bacterium]|nr:MAG: T9SS type A sorting domain-containing protein [Flavobacteriales bacterium]